MLLFSVILLKYPFTREIALYGYHSQKMTFPIIFLQILVFKASLYFALTECPRTQSKSQCDISQNGFLSLKDPGDTARVF